MPNDVKIDEDLLRELLEQSAAATKQATTTLAALPGLLADALGRPQAQPADAGAQGAAALAAPARVNSATSVVGKKVPDFWETAPTAWFKILDGCLDRFDPPLSEDAMLPLLHGKAVQKMVRLVEASPANVYQQAKASLIKHFERSVEDKIAELHGLSSLGDRTAVDFLEHMRSLQPGEPETRLFRHIFVHSLPSHVRPIVSGTESLDDMASAVDLILRTNPAPAVVASVGSSPGDLMVAAAHIPRDQLTDGLCFIHLGHGRNAYNCACPDTCKMKQVIKKKTNRASGNAPAGSQ